MSNVSIATIRQMLQDRVDQLVRELVPGGFMRSGLYEAPNPTRGDRKAGSFKIYMRGAVAGKWVDYAGVNAPFVEGGDRGDIIDLIAYIACARDRKQAIAWAKDWLGVATLPNAERERLQRLAQARKLAAVKKDNDERERRMRRAFDLFLAARIGLQGTPAAVYLLNRGIDLVDVPGFNAQDIRFHPGLEYTQGRVYDEIGGRRVVAQPGPTLPAIISAIRVRTGAITGIHITYLDGEDPGDRARAKIMLGAVAGGVIRIAHGREGLAPEDVREQRHLAELAPTILCEGLEDGLTLAMAVPEARVWAATSLGNLGNVYLDHPCVGDVIVARDNDWRSPTAVAQFEHAVALLEAHGKPVSQMAAIAGKDFNDLLRM
jgi:hypothetical protein